eukprot:CAMPEP_0182928664 /NCGR_PEP_ID=MMETSP0105_2-20130417/15702_1 /TAXON_ID=81532 ORGANISM="Acanthoeca-like sp., Strain 10tr" /NCGR_SAMPLE_ID=MMETSP0105_2 /ASSEMBLY_ACC=CAM_ASM_000205 /LENGTH=181 /DNA_ID=CAMNT_0025066673 /DNA_START=108 /DNA_END=654 /DNA_ORIENTATION=+
MSPPNIPPTGPGRWVRNRAEVQLISMPPMPPRRTRRRHAAWAVGRAFSVTLSLLRHVRQRTTTPIIYRVAEVSTVVARCLGMVQVVEVRPTEVGVAMVTVHWIDKRKKIGIHEEKRMCRSDEARDAWSGECDNGLDNREGQAVPGTGIVAFVVVRVNPAVKRLLVHCDVIDEEVEVSPKGV